MKLEENSNGRHKKPRRSKTGGQAPSQEAKESPSDPSLGELGQLALDRLESLGDSLRTLWAVRKDRAQLAFRQQIQTWSLIAIGAIGAIVAIVHAVALLVEGTASGFARLFPDASWLGDIAAGVLYLVLIGGGIAFVLWRSNRRQFLEQRAKYEELHRKRLLRTKTAAH